MSDYQGPPHMAQQQYQVRYNIQPGQQPMHQMMSQPMPMQAPVQHQQMMMHNPSQQQMQQHHAQMQMQHHHMQRPQGMMQMQHHMVQQRPTPQMIQQSQMAPANQGPGGLPPHSQHQTQPQHPQQSQGQQQFSGHQQQPQQQQQQMPPHSQAHHPQYIQMGAPRPSMAVYGHSHQPPPGPGATTMAPQQHGGQHGYTQQFQQQPMMRPQIRYVHHGQMPLRQELPHGGPQMVPQSTGSQPSALRQALGHVTVIAQPHQQPGAPDMKPTVHIAQVAGPAPPGMQPSVSTNGHHVIATVAQSSVNIASHPGPQQISQQPSMAQRPHTPMSIKEEMKEMAESPPRPQTQQSRTPMKKPAPKSAKGSGKANKSIAPKANGGPPSASSNGVPSVSTMVGTPGTASAHHLLGKRPLEELTKGVDANETLDDDVAEAVLQLVDDFVDDLVQSSARLARHRNGAKVEARDVRFVLTRKFNMVLPTQSSSNGAGMPGTSGSGSGPPSKKPAVTAHQQRLALIEKSLKKP